MGLLYEGCFLVVTLGEIRSLARQGPWDESGKWWSFCGWPACISHTYTADLWLSLEYMWHYHLWRPVMLQKPKMEVRPVTAAADRLLLNRQGGYWSSKSGDITLTCMSAFELVIALGVMFVCCFFFLVNFWNVYGGITHFVVCVSLGSQRCFGYGELVWYQLCLRTVF